MGARAPRASPLEECRAQCQGQGREGQRPGGGGGGVRRAVAVVRVAVAHLDRHQRRLLVAVVLEVDWRAVPRLARVVLVSSRGLHARAPTINSFARVTHSGIALQRRSCMEERADDSESEGGFLHHICLLQKVLALYKNKWIF